jgi:hypothetical protein
MLLHRSLAMPWWAGDSELLIGPFDTEGEAFRGCKANAQQWSSSRRQEDVAMILHKRT